jgi:two-component system cell cycle response regulator
LGYRFVLKMGLLLFPLFMLVWISASSLHSQRHSLDLILQEVLHEKDPVMVLQTKMHQAVSLIYRHLLADDKVESGLQFEILKGEVNALLATRGAMQFGQEQEWQCYKKVGENWQRIEAVATKIFSNRPSEGPVDTEALYREVDQASGAITVQIRLIRRMADAEIGEAEGRIRMLEQKAVWAVYSALIAGLAIVVLVGILLARSVLLPMRELSNGAKELASGNLGYRLQVDRQDEFGSLMTTFNEMAAALQRSQDDLKDIAIRDPLTGLYNHREFFRLLQEEVDRSCRYERALALLMMDLDKFKEINDKEGHLVGDQVLRHVARTIRAQIRKSDHASRYGGDEFAVLLPETDLEEAVEFAERFQKTVADRPLRLLSGEKLYISLSIGVASFPKNATTYMELVAVADQSMYRAKHDPSQQVCCQHLSGRPS